MEINGKTKLLDLLERYPHLEEKIIDVAPPFKNLKNPVLRKTVGRLATVEKAAQIGNIDALAFVNLLRREAGLPEVAPGVEGDTLPDYQAGADDPDWLHGQPQFVVNGSEMLARGEVPLNRINELLQQLKPDGYLLLLTNFTPTPMIEAVSKQGRQVFHKVDARDPQQHYTFIK